jgi:hypothetical protein
MVGSAKHLLILIFPSPGPATPHRPELSEALIKFVKTDGEVTGGLHSLGEALRDAPAYYKAIQGQFENIADSPGIVRRDLCLKTVRMLIT